MSLKGKGSPGPPWARTFHWGGSVVHGRCPHVPCLVCSVLLLRAGITNADAALSLYLPRSLRTQQPPFSIVAYPWPASSPPLGHQALSDLQAQRDIAAQPLPQLQHGESPGCMGIGCWTPPPLQQSLLYMAPLLEPHQVVSGFIPGVFGCWTPVQHAHFALSSERFLPSQEPAYPAPVSTRIKNMVHFNRDQLDFAPGINSNKVALESSSLVEN